MTRRATGRKGMRMNETATSAWLRSAATLLAVASIVLVLVNAGLALRNQGAQGEVGQRQQIINQAAQYSRVSQLLVQTAGRIAINSKDDALSAALERHGIKLTVNPPPSEAAPAAGAKP